MDVDETAALDPYFEGYMRPSIHRLMLSDGPRMAAYRAAIQRLDLRGKTVLDVGAGTGLLALWCAKQGAARVLAVEASPMARVAREIVEANGLGAVVEVHECRVEDLQLAPHSVHLVVSEWMGFHLVNESMLDSVLAARDALLAPGGRMLPGAVSRSVWLSSLFLSFSLCRSGCLRLRCSATPRRSSGATPTRRAGWT